MSLEKATYPLLIDGGINTKTDDKLLAPGENLILENVEFDEVGALNLRNGFDKLSDLTNDSSTLSSQSPVALVEHGNELLAIGKSGSGKNYSYNPQSSTWNIKGGVSNSPFVFVEDKYADEYNSFSPSCAEIVSKNTRVIAYITNDDMQTANTKYYLKVFVQDHVTKEKKLIYSITSILNPLKTCLVRVYDAATPIIFLTYAKYIAGDLELQCTTMHLDGSSVANVALSKYTSAWGLGYSTTLIGDKLFVIQDHLTVSKVKAYMISTTSVVTDSLEITLGTNKIATYTCLHCVAYGTKVLFAFQNVDATNKLTVIGLETSPALVINFAELLVGTGTIIDDVPAKRLSLSLYSSNTKLLIIWEFAGNSVNGSMLATTVDVVGHAQVVSVYCEQGMILASNVFSIDSSDDRYFIGQSCVFDNERYHICKKSTTSSRIEIVGAFAINGLAMSSKRVYKATAPTTTILYETIVQPDVIVGRDSKLYFPSIYLTKRIGTEGYARWVYVGSVYLTRIDFNSKYDGICAKLGGNTIFAGSLPKEYDGINFIEQSFLDNTPLWPEQTAVAGLPAGTYKYSGYFEYIDSNGQIHRSRPFTAKSITTGGAFNVDIDYLVTNSDAFGIARGVKDTIGASYNTYLFRTVSGGTVLYKLGMSDATGRYYYGVNSVTTYPDIEFDSTIVSQETIYSSNGILDNNPLPPIKYLTVANNRIFAISSEDENIIYYSQPYLEGESVNFSEFLSLRIDAGLLSRSGIGEALGTIDGKIIIFKDQSIAYFSGNGPNQAGQQNDFTDPKLISSDVGIKDVKSIVSIPDGLMFKSNKGIYLLDRSLNLSYIGYPVEDFNSEEIVGTSSIIDKHVVLFLTANRTLAYDYLAKKWSYWTTKGRALATYKKLPVYLDSIYRVQYQNTSSYLDDTTRYSMKLVTPWIKLQGIQNYQRIYKLMILGTFYSAHTLTVKSYYDYSDTELSTYNIAPLIGDDRYQYDVSIIKQKGQSMKFEIVSNSVAGTNKCMKLSNLSMILGKKKGLNKTPDTRKY